MWAQEAIFTLTLVGHEQKVSLSYKCSEMDRQLPEQLGVSAAILSNVIFCHQEDSNWPLQDGGTLEKFDDILESSHVGCCHYCDSHICCCHSVHLDFEWVHS